MEAEAVKKLIEKGVAKYKDKMAGSILRPQLGHETATKDAIRHFAHALGDANPLWTSEDYAALSVHGGLVAPPTFLNAISEGQAIEGLPGLVTTFVGADWEWFHTIRVNDRFSVTNRLNDLEDKSVNAPIYRFLQTGLLEYVNHKGETVGHCKWYALRTEMKPGTGGKKKKNGDKPECRMHRYSAEEIEGIYATIDAEEIWGARPRYFEEVHVGQMLQPVVKGPLSIADMVAWAVGTGWHRASLANELRLLECRRRPGLSYTDPETGAPEPIANSHYWPSGATILMGSTLPLDLGFQRVCWFGHCLTNWMGDDGFLRNLSARLRGLVYFGDTNWCEGTVMEKRKAEGRYLVDVALSAQNQRGETTMTGTATVQLPSKKKTATQEG